MLSLLAAVTATILTLTVPAVPVLAGLGALRWRNGFLLAPVSIALIAAAAELGNLLGITWNPLSPLVLGLILGGLGLALRHLSGPRPGPGPVPGEPAAARRRVPRTMIAAEVGGLGGGLVLILARQLGLMGSPLAVSQTYDGIFHVNAIRWILNVGDASAWTVGSLVSRDHAASYYPAAWHQVASLVALESGHDVLIASNALMLVAAAIVWPLAVMALVRTCTRSGPLGVFAAGLLSGAFAAFPFAPSSWGILLPFFLSTALVPIGIALLAQAAGLAPPERRFSILQLAALLPATLLAIGAVHPQGIIAMLALGSPVLIWGLAQTWTRQARRRGPILPPLVATVAVVAVLVIAWDVWARFRPSRMSASWIPNTDLASAILRTLSLGATGNAGSWPLAVVVVLAALVVVLRTRSGWLVAAWSWAVIIAVQGQAGADPALRYAITGSWYSDTQRTSALPVILGIPLLAVGIDAAARLLTERARVGPTALAPVAGVSVVAAVAALSVLSPGAVDAMRFYATQWQDPDLLTADELALLQQLPDLVPEDAVIAVNPLNGGSLAYAVADRTVTPSFLAATRPDGSELIDSDLQALTEDPAVCDAAARLHVRYVLDFGNEELWGQYGSFPGISAAARDPEASVPVARVGNASLARLEPCTRSDGSTWG